MMDRGLDSMPSTLSQPLCLAQLSAPPIPESSSNICFHLEPSKHIRARSGIWPIWVTPGHPTP